MLAAVDIETKDPHLKQWGSGAVRKDGFIIGVGIYCPDLEIDDFYQPTDPIIQRVLEDPDIDKVFHNGVYDLDWLMNGYDFKVYGRCEDTMTRETLLDSYAFSYSLDACCSRRGVTGKNKGETIEAWYKENIGSGKAIENLDKIPFNVVGKYCRQDCKATYDLYNAQQPLLEEQGLLNCNDIEVRLYPALMNMHKNGFRLDIAARQQLSNQLNDEYDAGIEELEHTYGFEEGTLSLNSANDLVKIWKQEHLPIEYTATGKPSFASDVLEACTHPVAQKIKHLKGLIKLLGTFVDGGFVDNQFNEHLYSTFYPAKRDEGGTVTGRWSSADINLQQIPAREDKHGKEVRSLFIPEDGCLLGAFDYKQIEYRVFTHFASGPGAEEVQEKFRQDPNTDYHQMTIDMMGWNDMGKEGRHLAKNFNFGSIYGLGARSFAERFRSSLIHAHPDADPDNLFPLAQSLMNEYFRKVTFAKPTCNKIQETATRRGYVRTLSGRHQRLPPDDKVYKMVNYLIQGSAADLLKKAMDDAWDLGVFKILKLHAVVHDEIVFSIPKTKEGYEACVKLRDCMMNAYKLKIPIGVDTEIGPDWGHCTMKNWEEFENEYKTKSSND